MLLHYRDSSKIKTKKVVYEETYHARDSGTLEQLKELTTRRKAIEDSLNGNSQLTPAIAREMAGGITSPILQDLQKVERYLPLLENLVMHVQAANNDQRIVQWTIDLRLRWTSSLSGTGAFGLSVIKYFRIDSLSYELGMILFLYGALLRERALEVITTDLVEAATLFRRAAGVYQHMAKEVLPHLEIVLPPDRPPEATSSMASVMSLICLAEAQAVIVRKAEEKTTSGALLAKLHYGVVQFLEEASSLLRAHSGDWNDISDKFRRFITICSVLHEARSQRYIACDLKKMEKLGLAVGVLRYAMSRVQGKFSGDDAWRIVFKKETSDLGNLLRKCENENEFIWRERPPRVEELPVLEGKQIVTPIVYQPFRLDREFVFVT